MERADHEQAAVCGMLTIFTQLLPHMFSAGTPTPAGSWAWRTRLFKKEWILCKVEVLWMEKVLVVVVNKWDLV